MPVLHLDYQRDSRPLPWGGVILLGLGVVILALATGYYLHLDQRIADAEARIEQGERLAGRQRQASPFAGKDARALSAEVEQANRILRQLTLPWEAMFRAVEVSGDQTVALLSMEPDPAKGTVRISGEAKDFTAMLAYVKQLGKRDEFSRVLLQNHHVNAEDSERPVRFAIVASWKVAAP